MKKILSLLLCAVLALGVALPAMAVEPVSETGQPKILVAYFSCTDNTKKIAEYVAETLGVTAYRITPETPYTSSDLNYSDSSTRATREQNDSTARPAITGTVENMADYDVIFLGYPIWWGQAPKIMYTFVEQYSFEGKTVIPFCTSGSSGIGSSATNLKSGTNAAGTWQSGNRFSGSASKDAVASWVNGLTLPTTPTVRYTVTVTAGSGMSRVANSGAEAQTVTEGTAMTPVVYTAADGFYFPAEYNVTTVNGVSVTRNSSMQITVSGTPTATAALTLPAASEKTKEPTPNATFTATGSDSGVLTNVFAGMTYQIGSNAVQTISGTSIDLSGLSACTIQVVQLASDETKQNSDAQRITVSKAAAPIGIQTTGCTSAEQNDGTITGVSDGMEYRQDGASDWMNISSSSVTGLSGGLYYIRIKAQGTVLASDAVDVTVSAYHPETVATPVLPAGGSFTGSKRISITCATEDAEVYYTMDGSAPTASSTRYTEAFTITATTTVRAIAVKAGMANSEVAAATYTYAPDSSTPSRPSRPSTPSAPSAPSTITIPVSDSEHSVNISVSVSGKTASVSELSEREISSITSSDQASETVLFDLSVLNGGVDTVAIPAASFTKVTEALEKHSGDDTVTIRVAAGEASFDETALQTISEQAKAGSVRFSLMSVPMAELNDAQRTALAGKTTVGGYALSMTANNSVISDFRGGNVTITVPFTPEHATKGGDYHVYYVASDGYVERVNTKYSAESLIFTTSHFSNYVIAYGPQSNPFRNVAEGAYYYDAVLWAVSENITQGTGETTFSPDKSCTRGEMVTFLWRSAGSPEPKTTENPFADVKESDYYYKAVLWAVENEITFGITASSFGPGITVDRAQSVTFLYRYCGEKVDVENSFQDVSTGDYYYDAVLWAHENKITLGTGKSTFSPKNPCLRGQIVTLLYRVGQNGEETPPELNNPKVLVAYFSCTGSTEKIATYVADALGVTPYRIAPETPYTSADLNYSDSATRATREQNDPAARPAIDGTVESMADYDIIFLGYPIWWGQAPKIMYTFVESYDLAGKTIVPFCTSGSSGIGTSATNLSASTPGATWMNGNRFNGSASRDSIVNWINGLELELVAK